MLKIIKFLFWISISSCVLVIAIILGSYLTIRPSLPEISLVDEAQLQMPLKVYTEDKALIGEFGEIKRRPIDFVDIPPNIKNAFLAAEDDQFFNHQGISYTGLIRSVIRCLGPRGCFGGGGTISMQVVRGYLLTRDQTIVRKVKEIFLALELEGKLTKEEIFELYVNRNFFGNRSYGIEAAANTYFNKSSLDLTLAEAATIAAMAQSPSIPYDLLPKKFLFTYNSKISSLVNFPSSSSARNISLTFLTIVWSLVNKYPRTTCIDIVPPPPKHPLGPKHLITDLTRPV